MSPHDSPIFNAEKLPEALGCHEDEVLREFYQLYLVQLAELQNSPVMTTPVRDGQTMRLLAHKLKSSSLAVGATRLGDSLAQLEELCQSSSTRLLEEQVMSVLLTAQHTAEAVHARLQALSG